jgi:hypothetical protein
LETVIMNPRLAATATFCREVALPASVLAWLIAFGPPVIDRTGAAPIVDRLATSVSAGVRFANKLPPIALGAADLETASKANIVTASESVAVAPAASATPAAHEPDPIVTAALTDGSPALPAETPPEPAANISTASLEPDDVNRSVGSAELTDACPLLDSCVDRYLWSLYQRTPKEDAVTTREERKVTVKKKGRLVTVTRTFTRSADEDFSWKDPKAAANASMPLSDYVIGGMDRDFKLRLFHMLQVADKAGLAPGITSAFRDDYRQSIASGLKAANDRSYHGGSFRGGYGHGLAADIVSVNGATRTQRLASSETLWGWVDAHGKDFGIGRPYLGRDPPHVGPIDGKEYADHHPGMKTRQAGAAAKPRNKLALRDDRAAKRARMARSAKTGTT